MAATETHSVDIVFWKLYLDIIIIIIPSNELDTLRKNIPFYSVQEVIVSG